MCARYGDATHSDRACVLGKSIDVAYCPTWVIVNADANGYYRSKYDPALATALLDPSSAIAKQAKPTSVERRMIVADIAAMVRRDEVPIERALALVAKLIHDRDPKVAAGADFVSLHGAALPDDLFAAVKQWSIATYGPLARQLGWQRAKGDSDDVERLRAAVLDHVAFHDPAVRAQAEKLADKWLADRRGLPDDLVELALAAAAFKGTAAQFERASSPPQRPRRIKTSAFACSGRSAASPIQHWRRAHARSSSAPTSIPATRSSCSRPSSRGATRAKRRGRGSSSTSTR